MGVSKLLADKTLIATSASVASTLGPVQGRVQHPVSSSLMPMLAVGDIAGSVKTGLGEVRELGEI